MPFLNTLVLSRYIFAHGCNVMHLSFSLCPRNPESVVLKGLCSRFRHPREQEKVDASSCQQLSLTCKRLEHI